MKTVNQPLFAYLIWKEQMAKQYGQIVYAATKGAK